MAQFERLHFQVRVHASNRGAAVRLLLAALVSINELQNVHYPLTKELVGFGMVTSCFGFFESPALYKVGRNAFFFRI